MIKVTNIPDYSIHVLEMQDGQVAEVISPEKYRGRVVQRYDERLIVLGIVSGQCWPALFKTTTKMIPDFFVRPLPKGTCLTIS
jgi:hypothetical protein